MLDAISDFWKPSRKSDNTDQIDGASIKPGSSIGFGFIPQAEISGKRATVTAINTYVFDSDRMTSFVLEADDNTTVSMIIADSEQEKYVAISQKIPFAERAALFENSQLLACMDGDEKKRLSVKNNGKWASWTAPEYKKAIGGLKGKLVKGDFRSLGTIPGDAPSRDFSYTLLVSNNNEYALEIEQYDDNKMEVYATVYRRLTDIGEVAPPRDESQMELVPGKAKKVAKTAGELSALKPANDSDESENKKNNKKKSQPDVSQSSKPTPRIEEDTAEESVRLVVKDEPKVVLDSQPNEAPKVETKRQTLGEMAMEVSSLQTRELGPALSSGEEELKAVPNLPDSIEPVKEEVPNLSNVSVKEAKFFEPPKPEKLEHPEPPQAQQAKEETQEPPQETQADELDHLTVTHKMDDVSVNTEQALTESYEPNVPVELTALNQSQEPTPQPTQEEPKEQTMATFNANLNGNSDAKTDAYKARAISAPRLEVENDAVECELPAASRVIEEAIRNEMSMSDVIRRVIALPVARQESVSIPIMLTDSDYALLANRYGIPAADRAAIKAKIVEEIGDFTGK